MLRPTDDGWRAVILKDEATICAILPSTRERPLLAVDGWWIDFLVKPPAVTIEPDENGVGGWEPINLAIQRIVERPPKPVLEKLIKYL